MPPRKRAEVPPAEPASPAPQPDTLPPVTETPAAETSTDEQPDGSAPPASGSTHDDTAGSTAPSTDGPRPERSDLQDVEDPCQDCFPAGWPDNVYALGCEHGMWMRT